MDVEFKVFVSRLPKKWTSELLTEHFEALFGDVLEAEVFTGRKKVWKAVENRKANICYAFLEGKCMKGDDCPFVHKEEEEEQRDSLGSGM
jgi:hypothetical protein